MNIGFSLDKNTQDNHKLLQIKKKGSNASQKPVAQVDKGEEKQEKLPNIAPWCMLSFRHQIISIRAQVRSSYPIRQCHSGAWLINR